MCTTGCKTGDHENWGACLRAKNLQVTELTGRDNRQAWDAELDSYADARRQGMQPRGTKAENVEEVKRIADATGVGNPWQ